MLFVLLCLFIVSRADYSAVVTQKDPPALSIANPVGSGHSPCKYTFNPAWVPLNDKGSHLVIVRAAVCPTEFGGNEDHLMVATCYANGKCDDLKPLIIPLEPSAEDPRIVFFQGWYYMFYFANGAGEKTVYLRKTQTPEDLKSWKLLANLPWHRNGCVLLRPDYPQYVLFGESPPLVGVGLAKTMDFEHFETVNSTLFLRNGPDDPKAPEIVIEASTPLVKLSTGDYFHIYCGGTPGWVANGNYTCGWVVLDGKNPNHLIARSPTHFLAPTEPWELGNGKYPVQRYRTIFATSLVPTGNAVDEFRVWYGAADANVASAIIRVRKTGEDD